MINTSDMIQRRGQDKGVRWDLIKNAVERFPELKPFFLHLAQLAAKGKTLPATFTAGKLGYEARLALNGILHTATSIDKNGKVHGSLLPELRQPSEWQSVIELFAIAEQPKRENEVAAMFTRLKWNHEAWKQHLDILAVTDGVRRFLKNAEDCRRWMKLFDGALAVVENNEDLLFTLSQLGSDLFNDSKCLRTGSLRNQLAIILGVLTDAEEPDERKLLSRFGIVDNPYTSCVTLFAPFEFTLHDGTHYDFTLKLFRQGLACQLPLETVSKIESVKWFGAGNEFVTSENAAPFARYVEMGVSSLYTEGYPNYAVQKMLGLFAGCGLSAAHAGDVDLDGIRIAEAVRQQIHISRIIGVEQLHKNPLVPGIPFADAQKRRLSNFIQNHPDFPQVNVLQQLLELGEWYEQEALPL